MYTLSDYGGMIADSVRMDAYAYALKAAVGPETVVLDIGAAAGIHALLASKFGARRVYAVESNEAIHLAKELAKANGFADRIEFIQDLSTNITLPEPADVIVSDLRGVLPLFGLHIPSIIDARQRHLAPGGRLIPMRDALWASLVEAPSVYKEIVKPWDYPYGLNMEAAKKEVLNSWSRDNTEDFRLSHLLTDPNRWAVLDYGSINDPDVSANMTQQATRDGTAHGLLIWFDAELTEGVGFSNAPHAARIADVYGRGFFPLQEPVPIAKGDIIDLAIGAELLDDHYRWRWRTCIRSRDDASLVKVDFEQSA